ncbi:MAG: endolytic transglycosylase MltG [Candidatus Berkelbacteria bacterium]
MNEEKPKPKITAGTIIKLTIVFLLLIVIALSIFFFNKETTQKSNLLIDNKVVEVLDGSTPKQVSAMLSEQGVLKKGSLDLYYLLERVSHKNIIPGFYEITPTMSMKDIIALFGSGEFKQTKITFPEGWRMEQMAIRLDANGIVDYAEFTALAREYEGKLFPDTYYFKPKMTATEIVKMMTDDYSWRTENLAISDSDLIIASIVEREAANDADRALIAGIYKNRVKAGMKLQSDPTVEYGRDTNNLAKLSVEKQKEYSFWQPAHTVEFTSVVSPYNTYQVSGLPAGPLCSPGIASIKATLSPTASQYYYFLYGRDKKIHTAKTQAEHETNVQKYM